MIVFAHFSDTGRNLNCCWMTPKPKRYQNQGCLHFITFSCFQRRPLLESAAARETFERELERVRQWYGYYVAGYVVMPEPVHLLLGEPQRAKLSVVIQVLKQSAHAGCGPPNSDASGRFVTTTSRCGAKRSGWRSFDISIGIRCIVDLCRVRRTGHGAVSGSGGREPRGESRSSARGPCRDGDDSK